MPEIKDNHDILDQKLELEQKKALSKERIEDENARMKELETRFTQLGMSTSKWDSGTAGAKEGEMVSGRLWVAAHQWQKNDNYHCYTFNRNGEEVVYTGQWLEGTPQKGNDRIIFNSFDDAFPNTVQIAASNDLLMIANKHGTIHEEHKHKLIKPDGGPK